MADRKEAVARATGRPDGGFPSASGLPPGGELFNGSPLLKSSGAAIGPDFKAGNWIAGGVTSRHLHPE